MAGNCLKWDGIITVFQIWGDWDMKIGELGIRGFPIGSCKTRSPGLVCIIQIYSLKKHNTNYIMEGPVIKSNVITVRKYSLI